MANHRSDCATHNAPAFLPGPCDCGQESIADHIAEADKQGLVTFNYCGAVVSVSQEDLDGLVRGVRLMGDQQRQETKTRVEAATERLWAKMQDGSISDAERESLCDHLSIVCAYCIVEGRASEQTDTEFLSKLRRQ